jgi:epoxyqueuosine reductase QueG
MFYLRMLFNGSFVGVMKSHWLDRRKPAPVAERRVEHSPEEWARRIKDYALAVGVDKVGIARIRPEWVFEGDELPEQTVIVLAKRMDYESLAASIQRNFRKSIYEIVDIYYYGHLRARKLADWLRGRGWPARGFGNPMGTALNVLPAAIEAGIGELGKHGSLICPEMGALFRLAYVVTDVPVAPDGPRDYGIDDFCTRCQVCVRECPVDAIFNAKQMVRGVQRWYVDFDKCVPYFNEHSGCGICLAVCPFSLPGRGPLISRKMLRRRSRQP